MPQHIVQPGVTFPNIRAAGDFLFVSGTSSWRSGNTIIGAAADEVGTVSLDIRAQARATLENVAAHLAGAGAGLGDLVQVTTYLVTMNVFGGYNEVWAEFFPSSPPARTTVAVHQLPHPHLLIEMQATALRPKEQA